MTPKKQSGKSIIITRVSSDGQTANDQLPDCRDFCDKKEWEVVKEFVGIESAWKSYVPRKALHEALDYARTRHIVHVVFWSMDRFWRNRKLAMETLQTYRRDFGIQLHFVKQSYLEQIQEAPYPWNEVFYDILVSILSAMAEEESAEKSRRVKKAYESGHHPDWGKHGHGYTDEEIYRVYQEEESMRKASKRLPYTTKVGKKKFVSPAVISRAVKRFKVEKSKSE